MHVTLTNLGAIEVPYSSTNGSGFAFSLKPGVPFTTNTPEIVVASVGDNPTFREELKEAANFLMEALARLVTFWRDHHQKEQLQATVRVLVDNHGPNGLRVILGNNLDDITLDPGMTYTAIAPNYVELRELGV